jgi:hypothetical protein
MGLTNSGFNITTKNVDVDNSFMFEIKKKSGYIFNLQLTKYPTGNCQLSSIGYLNCLFTNGIRDKQTVHEVINECYRMMSWTKKLILVDVHEKHIIDVESCFHVKTKNPYTSTNGSKMCVLIVSMETV